MTAIEPHITRNGAAMAAPCLRDMTRVELTWVEKRIEFWIRFGRVVGEQFHDRAHRVLCFPPNSVFAFIRWAANDYGTILSRIDILRAVAPGKAYQTVPCVRPGAEILLKAETWPKVEEVLRHIDSIEAQGIDPVDADPDHWRHVGHWMRAGETPRSYTLARHRAWLRRREITK